MATMLKRCTVAVIGLAALSANAASAAPQTAPAQAVLYVAPVGEGETVMSYVPVRNAPSDEAELGKWRGLKTPLRVFDDGDEDGVATPLGFSIDDRTMCGGDLRVRLKTAHGPVLDHDALLATFDLNPGRRFTRSAPDATQRRALIQAIGSDPSVRKQLPAPALKRLLAHLAAPPADDDAPTLTVIADAKRPGHAVALVTASVHDAAPASAEEASSLTSLLAVLERGDAGWRLRMSFANHGCDDCEGRNDDYAQLQFGDVDADGNVDFLIQHAGYESYGFWLLHLVDGQWRTDDLVGGC